jgi:pSer/pThr/pTyr-binding forkhead associated (FHA) protein
MRLEVTKGTDAGKKAELEGERLTIGREPGIELELADDEISRRHAAVTRTPDGKVVVEDLASRNGTYVDGKRISEPTELSGGETIRVGQTEIGVTAAPAGAAETKVGAVPPPPPPPRSAASRGSRRSRTSCAPAAAAASPRSSGRCCSAR